MASINFTISYGKNDGLVMSPSELLEQYFHGIPICTKDGRDLTMETIKQKIRIAQDTVEKYLSLKMSKQVITERIDFIKNDWDEWGYLRTTFLVKDVVALVGFIATTKQIEYPLEWVSKVDRTDESLLSRNLHVVPAGSNTPVTTNSIIFNGITPHLGFLGTPNIPNYWSVKYVTGFTDTPDVLLDFVGKLASIQLLAILGDIILGIGLSSSSLSLDGLSQSTSLSRSGKDGIFGARINQYTTELKETQKFLKDTYKGITFINN